MHAGDGFFATFDGPARAILCAQAIVATVGELGLDVRSGCTPANASCTTASSQESRSTSRVAAAAGAREVIVSSTVKELVAGSEIAFEELGARPLKGVSGSVTFYVVQA